MSFRILLGLRDAPGDVEAVVLRLRGLGEDEEPPIASFYRALKKALDAGHIEPVATVEGKRGRPAQTYQITPSGRASLEAEARRLGRLSRLALSK